MSAEDKITKAKARLMRRQPFFAMIAFGVPFEEASWCPTMATDMFRIYWGREFVEKITDDELMGVISHEILHIAWLHCLRIGPSRNPKLWNIAADISINQTVLDARLPLPKDGVFGEQYNKYKDWPVEEIYADLEKNAVKINISFPSRDGKGDGTEGDKDGWGGILRPEKADGKGGSKELSDAEKAELEAEIKIKVLSAAVAAKSRGKLPACFEGLIEAAGKPKINWKDYIQNWVSGHTPDDYSWSRPNRKMLANHGVYMPRMKLNGAGIGALSIDTSGSVSDNELRSYVREIVGVIELCSPEKLYIIQHDAVIQDVYVWEEGDEFTSLKVKGRGGTMIQPTFKQIAKLEDEIDWLICFTDMGIGDWPKTAPDYPVLWCATGPDCAPFGTYLPLKDTMQG